MSNRKNYNSILFLTVYFGLVLVGGSSHVLAHGATNQLFDLRNEIEFKEDLDNKPDDSCAKLKTEIDEQDIQFIEEYIQKVSSFLKGYTPDIEGEMLNGVGSTDFSTLREEFEINFFQLRANKNRFLGKINLKTFETKKATNFALVFNQILDFQRCKSQNFPEKVIYENTKVLSSNNQVFIVTRLPRASIDSFLK